VQGEFALVRLKDSDSKSWLLIKHRDSFAVDKPYDSEEETPIIPLSINGWLRTSPKKSPQKKSPDAR
jgi:bifunctional non-homologous end joining protein LigD